MKRSRYSDEQIAYVLRQAEGGTPVADICRTMGIGEATFYIWKKKYANLGTSEIRELRQLRDENAKLKRLVADLTLDKHILGEIIRKKSEAGTQTRARRVGANSLRSEFVSSVSAGADFLFAASISQPTSEPGGAQAAHA
jgi:putative transposase